MPFFDRSRNAQSCFFLRRTSKAIPPKARLAAATDSPMAPPQPPQPLLAVVPLEEELEEDVELVGVELVELPGVEEELLWAVQAAVKVISPVTGVAKS